MAQIQVSSQYLRQQAEALRQLNESLKTQVTTLNDVESVLVGMWEGDAKNAFHTAYSHDRDQFGLFSQMIMTYITALENAAQEYDTKEAANVEIGTMRKY